MRAVHQLMSAGKNKNKTAKNRGQEHSSQRACQVEGEVTNGQSGEVTASAEGGYEWRGNAPLVANGSTKK